MLVRKGIIPVVAVSTCDTVLEDVVGFKGRTTHEDVRTLKSWFWKEIENPLATL